MPSPIATLLAVFMPLLTAAAQARPAPEPDAGAWSWIWVALVVLIAGGVYLGRLARVRRLPPRGGA